MASSRESNSGATHNLVDDLESAFQNCISLLTSQEHFNVRRHQSAQDAEETKAGVEVSVQRFLESARQLDSYFLSQRLNISAAKPEHVLNDDIVELKAELERKEKLIEKHQEKLQKWQALFRSNQPIIPTTTPSSPYPGGTASSHQPTSAMIQQGMTMTPAAGTGVGGQPPSMTMQGPMAGQPSMMPQQAGASLPQGQYPGPPAGHPGQYIMPPPAYPQGPQGPLAFLERM